MTIESGLRGAVAAAEFHCILSFQALAEVVRDGRTLTELDRRAAGELAELAHALHELVGQARRGDQALVEAESLVRAKAERIVQRASELRADLERPR